MWKCYHVKYRSFIVLKFSSPSASAQVRLSQLGTSLRILSSAKSGSCIFSPLRTAISTSPLWNLHHARCCFVCSDEWSFRKCDPSSWQCSLTETRVVAVIWSRSSGYSMCWFGSLREFLGGHKLQKKSEGMEMAVHEWLQTQKPGLCHNGISKLLQRCGRCIKFLADYVEK